MCRGHFRLLEYWYLEITCVRSFSWKRSQLLHVTLTWIILLNLRVHYQAKNIMQLTCQLYVQCITANESTEIAISACDYGSIEILRSRYGEDRGVACSTDVGHHSREVPTWYWYCIEWSTLVLWESNSVCSYTRSGALEARSCPPGGYWWTRGTEGTCVGDDVTRTEECSHWWVVDVKGWTGSCVIIYGLRICVNRFSQKAMNSKHQLRKEKLISN